MADAMQTVEGSTSEAPNGLLFECRIEMPYGLYSKKNSKSIAWRGKHSSKRPFIRTNDKALYIERYILSVLSGIPTSLRPEKPLHCALHGLFWIYSPSFLRKDGHLNLRGGDLENLIQGPMDALTKCGIIKDDSLFTRIEAIKCSGEAAIKIQIFEDKIFNVLCGPQLKPKRRQP